MSLLAPLYIAGALAVALPILFHLIRRTPEGRQEFSSLMFLAPSPPRITRRSRLSNLLLLLLRAAALTLLAIAFARPFLRRSADEALSKPQGRRVALLVDTSASMRRGDLWAQAKGQVDKVLGELTPADEVALFFFDRQVRPGMTFAEWRETPDAAQRAATVRARLAEASPTWSPTRLGDALATTADLLAETDGSARSGGASAASIGRQIVLVSDVQQGAHAEALQGHEWPQNVLLDVRPVALKQSANASVQVVRDAPGAAGEDETGTAAKGEAAADAARRSSDAGRLRVRVTNQADSPREQFSLVWADARGPVPGAQPLKVYVPPGRGQTVRVAWPAPGDRQADRLVLSGDDADFDNTLYVVPPTTETLRLLFVGDDAPGDTKGLLYYLRSAAGDTARQKVELVARRPADPPSDVDLLDARLVVVASPLPENRAAGLRRWAESGGTVLWVLKDASAAQTQSLAAMTGAGSLEVIEAPKSNFALLARVDFEHPLFAPFADSRFGDFTKIHFWQHRRVKLGAGTAARAVASFDDGDPFLIEQPLGKGRLLIATSGWHPADSQLALSTKFVPLISGLLRGGKSGEDDAAFVVGEPVAVPQDPSRSPATRTTTTVIAPDGTRQELQAAATTFAGADQPGIYRIVRDGKETPLAVNVSPDESRTAPLAPEELEHFGARLGTRPPSDELAARHRQLQIIELENRQKLWRWGIVAVLGLLAAETALAGRLARRSADPRRQGQTEPQDRAAPQDQVVTT
jgi:hypothetical protein